MITRFDNSGAAAAYKTKFAQLLDEGDYEEAVVVLFRYHELMHNDDFHLALGMLYFLMVQDSDDPELVSMAYREFLLHIMSHPDCERAYRDLLATAVLQRNGAAADCYKFIAAHGFDADKMLFDILDIGLSITDEPDECEDFMELFGPGEFGEIDELPPPEPEPGPVKKQQAKTVPFVNEAAAQSFSVPKKQAERHERAGQGKTVDFAPADGDVPEDLVSFLEEHLPADGEYDEEAFKARVHISRAERYAERGDVDRAFAELDNIKPSAGDLYYCSECLRAYICIELGRLTDAEAAIARALGVRRDGALAGTLLCEVLELTDRTDEIPDVLKAIDVKDYIDAEHVHKAMLFTVEHCDRNDALELAGEYIDEFNTMDIRLMYAQMLYNAGERDEAMHELYVLSHLFYDDFNYRYFYLMAKMKADEMPVEEVVPQRLLGLFVDNVIAVAEGGLDDEMLENDAFRTGLDVFLTLEFSNSRTVEALMYKALATLAADPRLDGKMREALVSPYVESSVKGVILSELFKRSNKFLGERRFFVYDERTAAPKRWYTEGMRTAYAFALNFSSGAVAAFQKLVSKLRELPPLKGDPRDVAYYLLRETEREAGKFFNGDDGRLCHALGYKTKTAAQAAYKAIAAQLNK